MPIKSRYGAIRMIKIPIPAARMERAAMMSAASRFSHSVCLMESASAAGPKLGKFGYSTEYFSTASSSISTPSPGTSVAGKAPSTGSG